MSPNGQTRVTTLSQLAPATSDYTITNSATGEEFVVTLRDLLPDQIAELDARRKRVKPPVKGFKSGGIPDFNEDDPAYIEASEKAANDYVMMWLLESWVVEYPAGVETADDKMAAIRAGLPQWAFAEMNRRLREITGLKLSDVALEKKRLKATESDNSNIAPVA